MDYLLFSGPPNSGKTHSVRSFAQYLNHTLNYNIIDPVNYVIPPSGDIKCIMEKNGKQVMLVSETDQVTSVNALYSYFKANPQIEIVISASRDPGDQMRSYIFSKLDISNPINTHFEIPLGRMVKGGRRTNAITWYLNAIQEVTKKIGSLPPFSF